MVNFKNSRTNALFILVIGGLFSFLPELSRANAPLYESYSLPIDRFLVTGISTTKAEKLFLSGETQTGEDSFYADPFHITYPIYCKKNGEWMPLNSVSIVDHNQVTQTGSGIVNTNRVFLLRHVRFKDGRYSETYIKQTLEGSENESGYAYWSGYASNTVGGEVVGSDLAISGRHLGEKLYSSYSDPDQLPTDVQDSTVKVDTVEAESYQLPQQMIEMSYAAENYCGDIHEPAVLLNLSHPGRKTSDISMIFEEQDAAFGIAADGNSLGLLLIPVSLNVDRQLAHDTVIEISSDAPLSAIPKLHSYAEYHDSWTGGSVQKSTGSHTVAISNNDTLSINGKDYALVFISAPDSIDDEKFVKTTVSVLLDGEKADAWVPGRSLDVLVTRPPVLAVHGVWSSPESMMPLVKHFKESYYPSLFYGFVDYEEFSDEKFNSRNIQHRFDQGLQALLTQAAEQGLVSSQVDVIAHSMGGLVSREYSSSNAYLIPENYNNGSINRLVSIDTPHLGSEFANWLVAFKNNGIQVPSNNSGIVTSKWLGRLESEHDGGGVFRVSDVLLAQNKPINGGAVEGLVADGVLGIHNPELVSLSQRDNADYYSLVGITPPGSCTEKWIDLLMKFYDGPDLYTTRSLLGSSHDTIVSAGSQKEGAAYYVEVDDVQHTSSFCKSSPGGVLESRAAYTGILCLLSDDASCETDSGESFGSKEAASPSESLMDNDLGTSSELPSSTFNAHIVVGGDSTVINGVDLDSGIAASAEYYSADKEIVGVVTLYQGAYYEDAEEPFTFEIPTGRLGNLSFTSMSIYSDNSYAFRDFSINIVESGDIVSFHTIEPKVLLIGGPPTNLTIRGYFGARAEQVEITSGLTLTAVDGSIVAVDSEAKLVALRCGETLINVDYKSMKTSFSVKVIGDGCSSTPPATEDSGGTPVPGQPNASSPWAGNAVVPSINLLLLDEDK